MKLLQRYILSELISVFLLLVIILTVMLVFLGLFREATERGLGPVQILQIMPYVVPSMLPFTIPATLLLAVCVVYGRISGDLEVIAAKSAGISAMQLLMPAFLLGIVLAVGSFGLTNYAIPWAVTNIERIVTQALEEIFFDVLSSQHYFSNPDESYTITVRDVENRTLLDVTIRYRRNQQQFTVQAETARIHFDLEGKQILVNLKNVSGVGSDSNVSGKMQHTELKFPLEPELGKVKARDLPMTTLQQGIEQAQSDQDRLVAEKNIEAAMMLLTGEFAQLAGADFESMNAEQRRATKDERRFRSEIHNRFSMSASCWFFAFLGGPFAMLQARRQFITSFIICFLPILVVYYPTMFLIINLCKTGSIAPWWAMWVPNIIVGTAGFFVLRKVVQH
ncbi:MAG TPA: LptF/LptG family permease [Planctomycetaceae bacterium]|nr:LptF/LptG family permease [Planctomycetaceae bacterium]